MQEVCGYLILPNGNLISDVKATIDCNIVKSIQYNISIDDGIYQFINDEYMYILRMTEHGIEQEDYLIDT